MWARGRAASEECPNSLIAPRSIEWVERFHAWKFTGGRELEQLSARDADAFLQMEEEMRTEANHGQ